MNKRIVSFSLFAVIILTFVSFSNVVGYNTVKTSQENKIIDNIDFDYCKNYLFETIVEISDNQDVIEIIDSNFNQIPKPNNRFLIPYRSNFNFKIEHLELLYNIGIKAIEILGEDKIEELKDVVEIEKPEFTEDIYSIIMGNDELKERIYTLNEMNVKSEKLDWDFPIICGILDILFVITYGGVLILELIYSVIYNMAEISWFIYFFLFYPLMLLFVPVFIINLIIFTFYFFLCEPYYIGVS